MYLIEVKRHFERCLSLVVRKYLGSHRKLRLAGAECKINDDQLKKSSCSFRIAIQDSLNLLQSELTHRVAFCVDEHITQAT
jgi:hypothetical protein